MPATPADALPRSRKALLRGWFEILLWKRVLAGLALGVTVDDKLGINKPGFMTVLPLGAAIGKDSTAIYVGLLSMFRLQALGVEIAPASYLIVLLTATLAAFGTAPVPSASLFVLAAVLPPWVPVTIRLRWWSALCCRSSACST